MNKVMLIGRNVRPLELRYTSNNVPVVELILAINRQNKSGENTTDFIRCVAWNKSAEILSKYLGKGDMLGVEGRLSVRSYEDEQQKKHSITEVIIDNFQFLTAKKKETETPAPTPEPEYRQSDIYKDFGKEVEADMEDLPWV